MSDALNDIADYRLSTLKRLFLETTEKQQQLFKRMYSHKDLTADIETIINKMPDNKIDWAIQQCERTVEMNKKEE